MNPGFIGPIAPEHIHTVTGEISTQTVHGAGDASKTDADNKSKKKDKNKADSELFKES
jgi:hypothetical protein